MRYILLDTVVALAFCVGPAIAAEQAMSPSQLKNIQSVLASSPVRPLLALDPSLAAIENLDPKLDSHLDALGAMATQLGPEKSLPAAEILRAYYNPANLARIESVIRQRSEELKTADDPKAAAELATLAELGSGIKSKTMIKAVNDAKKIAANWDPSLAQKGDADGIEWVPILSLRPMQFGVGMSHQVVKKRDALLKMSPAEQKAFLLKHPIPVIERKNGAKHIDKGPMSRKETRPDDHHHLLRAAWEAGLAEVPIDRQKDEKKGGKKFWKQMKKDKLVYLYDEFGNGPHDPEDLPLDVRGLADDPYRDLAGWVRDLGGYDKTEAPFAEFKWAMFFRENLKAHPHADWDEAVKEAMELARSKAAKGLPGYRGKKSS